MKYNPQKIEKRWQKYWKSKKIYNTKDTLKDRHNFMLLTEFVYPSGDLHTGHWFAFAVPDILSRYLRMKGYNVMYPTGFDAFGLPAENAAIQRNINPRDWTEKNTKYMTKQFKSMGATFDWSRIVSTIDPEYYKWTQWIFLKLYEAGLAYRDKALVNWCPKDKTVLANEQVIDGKCDRCGTVVEQKELSQWMFKIIQFADQLTNDLNKLDWPETVKLAQKNWIGRSEGTIAEFKIDHSEDSIEVFTTRIDTIFGATYAVLAPEHPLVEKLKVQALNHDEVEKYIDLTKHKTELQRISEVKDKTGMPLQGITAINPMNEEKIPVWIADYVLVHYGTGAVMAVPAHDQRDFEFAKKYGLKSVPVVLPSYIGTCTKAWMSDNQVNDKDNILEVIKKSVTDGENTYIYRGSLINSGEFNGLTSDEARKKITEELKKRGLGNFQKRYRLHDWILSRQRYWGTPIPMIHCEKCALRDPSGQGYQPVPEQDLPVKLPPLKDFLPTDDGRSPLAKAKSWVKVKCPKCEGPAERETDTMDTFVDSSWYFLRYSDPKNKKQFASKEKMKKWLPIPMYIGGAEHNTVHLLYSRFVTKALRSLGYLNFSEPFMVRRNHGIILGPDGQKMSKSRGNVIDPDENVAKYGADTVRMYLAFMGPYSQDAPWNMKGIVGVYRFLNRAWNLFNLNLKSKISNLENKKEEPEELKIKLNRAIKKIGEDISSLKFNTAVAELMKLLNEFESTISLGSKIQDTQYDILLKLLAPFAPHLAEEIWQGVLKNRKSIHLESWPSYSEKLLTEELTTIVVQVNGKVRGTIYARNGLNQEEVKQLALLSESVNRHVGQMSIKKIVYVEDKIINIVT